MKQIKFGRMYRSKDDAKTLLEGCEYSEYLIPIRSLNIAAIVVYYPYYNRQSICGKTWFTEEYTLIDKPEWK